MNQKTRLAALWFCAPDVKLSPSKSNVHKALVLFCGALIVIVAIGSVLFEHFWPFTEEAVRRDLGEAASAHVSFSSFRTRYFPPGCMAEGVVFEKNTSARPVITIRQLTIRSSLAGLFGHRVSLIRAEGAHVIWQAAGSSNSRKSKATIVDRLEADDAVLEVPRESADGPLYFVFRQFAVTNLRGPGQSGFLAEFDNPLPKGSLRVSGHFGPWDNSAPEKTALDGEYALENADLGVFHSIAGFVSSKGEFRGAFDALDVQGQTSTPKLTVTSTQHGLALETNFVARVNGATADVTLERIKAQFGRDQLDIHGTIGRTQNGRRTAKLEIDCHRGRIEDTFYPFIRSPQSPLTGDVKFRMDVRIPSGEERFLKKVALSSTFGISNAHFARPETQVRVSKIAEAPNQHGPDTLAPTSLQGKVSLSGGIATFSELRWEEQEAAAKFHGNFNVLDQRVNLHGELKTATSLTKSTHGVKAVFAKAIEPFFKKRPHETVVPVKIGGTYNQPQCGLDLPQKN